MNSNANIVATFKDKFDEDRHIHSTRHGLTVKRRTDTHNQVLSKAISGYIGERIRAIRQRKEMTMDELGRRAGLTSGNGMKSRVYEIEKNQRSIGIRFGTVYQIAIALEVEIMELMPSTETVKAMTGARLSNAQVLSRG
ncbi:MAG TPA: helix-turn-helix transcriptional regulator [Candidatus Limnocylindrales bacterium]|nr:helix-turn-helix transcriptional regulator [Candidatus Limnocylindrales bacterium]